MDFENCKYAAQFPFTQPKNTFIVPNATSFIDFGLNMLATGLVGLTIRISVVTQPLNFPVFNRVFCRNHRRCFSLVTFKLRTLTKML